MQYLPIVLGIARPDAPVASGSSRQKGAGRRSGGSSAVPQDVKNRILARDDYTCRYCGFKSKKYQDVQVRNHDPSDHSDDNLATACIFCHQCFNLQAVGQMKSGMLIWLPEIEQAALHHMARTLYIARISQGPVAEAARAAHDALIARREEAKRRLSTDDPATLAVVLRDYLGPREYQARTKKLEGIRLFPLDRRIIKESDLEFNQFPQILAYWRSKDGPFGGKPPQQWAGYYQELMRAA
ncbi:MAG: HNH endonuclease [Alphaproteobacteria bacterium]|nr:HNH endonuclease [Alphaproteobacteria bacterium]